MLIPVSGPEVQALSKVVGSRVVSSMDSFVVGFFFSHSVALAAAVAVIEVGVRVALHYGRRPSEPVQRWSSAASPPLASLRRR